MTRANRVILFLLYVIYNIFIKVFYSIVEPVLFTEFPGRIAGLSFLKDTSTNPATYITSNVFNNILFDWIYLFPVTTMNLIFFATLLSRHINAKKSILAHQAVLLLTTFCCWSALCWIVFGLKNISISAGFITTMVSAYPPYGSLMIVYYLLGNFVFALIFKSLWSWKLKEWTLVNSNENEVI